MFNPTSGFVVTSKAGSGPGLFIFSAEAGQISAWNPVADPVVNGASTAQVVFSSRTAVYKGLTIASNGRGTFLFASNFHDGRVDVFNSKFHRVRMPGNQGPVPACGLRAVRDPGHRRFHLRQYALQNAAKHDDVAGPGHGLHRHLHHGRIPGEALVSGVTSTPRGGSRRRRPGWANTIPVGSSWWAISGTA